MKALYVQAFLEMLQEGTSIEAALSGLHGALERKNHTKLFVPVLLEVQRVLVARKGVKEVVVTTASKETAKALSAEIAAALLELGVTKDIAVKTEVDETLIGGFVATFDYKEHDQSYKKALTNLYQAITK